MKKAIERVESFMIRKALEKYSSQNKVARALGVNQSTIARKMRKYGINSNVLVHK